MSKRFILPLVLAIIATTLIVLNIIYNPIFWLKIVFGIGLGALNGYCIAKAYFEYSSDKQTHKLLKQAEKEFMKYINWQETHKDMSVEDYFKYHGGKR